MNFEKIVRIGNHPAQVYGVSCNIYCKIVFKDGKLSITGVEGPTSDGNCRGSCGQIIMDLDAAEVVPAPNWTQGKIQQVLDVWNKWHLNDMRAGSPAQRSWLKAHPCKSYEEAKLSLEAAGLQPDPDYLHKGKPYSYGSAWLKVDVPEDVLQFLQSLPDTDTTPAWV